MRALFSTAYGWGRRDRLLDLPPVMRILEWLSWIILDDIGMVYLGLPRKYFRVDFKVSFAEQTFILSQESRVSEKTSRQAELRKMRKSLGPKILRGLITGGINFK